MTFMPGPTRPLRPGEGACFVRLVSLLLLLAAAGLLGWTLLQWAARGWKPQMTALFIYSACIAAAGLLLLGLHRLWHRYF